MCYTDYKYSIQSCVAENYNEKHLCNKGWIHMNNKNETVEKSLHISQDVIAQIIINCINEIDGVYSVAPVMKTPRQIWLKQENYGNIRIGLVDDVISVTIGIILECGSKAMAISELIQEKVKSSIQSMLGLMVARVNINVCGVHTASNKA